MCFVDKSPFSWFLTSPFMVMSWCFPGMFSLFLVMSTSHVIDSLFLIMTWNKLLLVFSEIFPWWFVSSSCVSDVKIEGSSSLMWCLIVSFWHCLASLFQGISEASVKVGAVYKYDLSLPVDQFYGIVEEMRNRLGI